MEKIRETHKEARLFTNVFLSARRGFCFLFSGRIAFRNVRYRTLSLMARGKYLRLPRVRSRRNCRVCEVIGIEPRKLSCKR